MAKNNARILIPKFLDASKVRDLNNLVYRNTGCFLFLTIPDDEILLPWPETAGCDNYRYNVINLYKMYNDYGHYFLWFAVQESQLPQKSALDDVEMSNRVEELSREQSRVTEHYSFVARIARHVITHGIFQRRITISPYTDPKIAEMERIFCELLQGKQWPQSQSDWTKINKWLVQEADFAYDWLYSWAEIWNNCSKEKDGLQRRFYYGRWEYSTNRDECRSVDDESIISKQFEGGSFSIYEENDKDLTSFARVFSLQFVNDARDYLAATAPNCKSEYEEGKGPWRSDRPEVNIRCLFKNINFAGIENVRQIMYHPLQKEIVCPDCYRLYLDGLTKKMLSLPSVNARPQGKSRFSRR